jgi:hypothetical protein
MRSRKIVIFPAPQFVILLHCQQGLCYAYAKLINRQTEFFMPSPNTLGDPRSGRDRRVPTKTRAFKHGHIDPVTSHKRPLLTVGNVLLLIVGVGFGMYATGNLPQLDAFFDHADQVGKAHNNAVVNTLITYGTIIFGAVLVALFCLMVFLFFNSRRRTHVDGKGWHKVTNASAERRSRERRATANMPSHVMPLGKERPTTDNVSTPIVAKTEPVAPAITAAMSQPVDPAKPETATPAPDAAKAEAIAAAAKAEAAIATTPAGPPSFVRAPKLKVEAAAPTSVTVAKPEPVVAPIVTAAPPANMKTEQVASLPTAPKPVDTSLLSAKAATAKVEAAVAEAKAIAARAEATMANAKLEALIATAKAEAAAAEARIAAAKATSLTP